MTQSISAEVQRLPTLSGPGAIRPSIRPNAPVRRQTEIRSGAQIVDLTDDSTSPITDVHPAKRRRVEGLEHGQNGILGRIDGQMSSRATGLAAHAGSGPPVSFAVQLAQARQTGSGAESISKGAAASKFPPLPIRPWKHKTSQPDITIGGGPVQGIRDYGKVQAVPFRLEPTQEAPSYREGKVADFLPWAGKHPEDVMNEQTAKQGYYDRQISQNETGTARPSLYSVFKHKSGLDTLSALFLRAVEQRQTHGKINSASNFKPPPRVTLTDARRKAWLSDLADPNVPLRKLSRTVPQGIRGQQLVELSLAHSVPIARAVWFAKCVGANEIRTLKRKGTSGTFVAGAELKWLKEWTAGVELFLEDVISSCGQENWKPRMAYALNIVTRFYSENMLDKDHFIEWLTSGMKKSDLDLLPLWLTISRGFLEDIVRLRRHGRVLSEALLRHLQTAKAQDSDDFTPLISTLSQAVHIVARTRPLLFILPQLWQDHRETFKSCLNLEDPSDQIMLSDLETQNSHLMAIKDSSALNTLSPQQLVIKTLDTAKAPFDVTHLSEACLKACQDQYQLVRTVLEWSSTTFRVGSARRYLSVHLLRLWHGKGLDIDQPVRDIFMSRETINAIRMDTFFQVTADLFRSKTISISRCLQLALATGATKQSSWDKSNSGILRLIEAAPVDCMPLHTRNLRNSILARAGYPADKERHRLDACKYMISKQLPAIFKSNEDISMSEIEQTEVASLPRCSKSEVSRWLFEYVAQHCKASSINVKHANATREFGLCALTFEELQTVRAVLEEVEDIPILADVLRFACNSEDDLVLASVAETLNAHFDEFSAIGALTPLSSLLCNSYTRSRANSMSTKSFTVSLLNFTARLPNSPIRRAQLLEDLARGERSVAIAACSPISDHMAESLQQAGSSFADEFDQLLSGGNIMDDQAMTRLFYTLTERIESSDKSDGVNLCHLLLRLMAFRTKQFEQLLQIWFKRLLQSSKPSVVGSIELLIGSGVATTDQVVSASTEHMRQPYSADVPEETRNVRNNLLTLFERCYTNEAASKDPIIYRLRYCKTRCVVNMSPAIGPVMAAICNHTISRTRDMQKIPSWICDNIIHRHIDIAPTSPISGVRTEDALVCAHLLGVPSPMESVTHATISTIIESHDAKSLPLRAAYLKFIFAKLPTSKEAGKVTQEDVINLLFESAKRVNDYKENYWTALLAILGTEAAQKIRQQAEEAIFSIPPPHSNAHGREDKYTNSSSEMMLGIIQKTAFTIPESGVPSIAVQITERLQSLFRFVSMQSHQLNVEDTEQSPIWNNNLQKYLTQLLQLTTLHRSSFVPSSTVQPGSNPQAQSQLQVRTLLILTSLALHPSLQPNSSITLSDGLLQNKALNTALILSDDLPAESRHVVSRHLKDRMRDPRARFLFGSLTMDSTSSSEQVGNELIISRPGSESGKEPLSTEYRVRSWELVQGIGGGAAAANNGGANDTSMSLSLFQGRVVVGKDY